VDKDLSQVQNKICVSNHVVKDLERFTSSMSRNLMELTSFVVNYIELYIENALMYEDGVMELFK